jgi:hypothetical protein
MSQISTAVKKTINETIVTKSTHNKSTLMSNNRPDFIDEIKNKNFKLNKVDHSKIVKPPSASAGIFSQEEILKALNGLRRTDKSKPIEILI